MFSIVLGFFFGLLAFNCQEYLREKRENGKALRCFFQEMRLNLTLCDYMVENRKFKLFDIHGLNEVKYNSLLPASESIEKYVLTVEFVNSAISDFLNFESFYTSNSSNRTRENEEGLHSKRLRTSESLESFREIIRMARECEILQKKVDWNHNAYKKKGVEYN